MARKRRQSRPSRAAVHDEPHDSNVVDSDAMYKCPCLQARDIGEMICCDDCDGWFHCECLGIKLQKNARGLTLPIKYWQCPECLYAGEQGEGREAGEEETEVGKAGGAEALDGWGMRHSDPAKWGSEDPQDDEQQGQVHPQQVNLLLSVASGALAALATLFAKLAANEAATGEDARSLVSKPLLYAFPALVVVCNFAMWAVFTRALNSSHSTAAVSVLNNSANMIASAFLGYLMFDEELSVKWWIGCILVIAGSALMNRGAQSTLSNAKVKCE